MFKQQLGYRSSSGNSSSSSGKKSYEIWERDKQTEMKWTTLVPLGLISLHSLARFLLTFVSHILLWTEKCVMGNTNILK